MRITLTVDGARAGPLGPHAIRAFGAEGGTIGRSPEADWALPDPNRFLSQFHARIVWQDEAFWLEDTSSNGTFVNGAPTALGRGARHRLAEGDRLALGDYAVFVSLAAQDQEEARPGAALPAPPAFAPPAFAAPAFAAPGFDAPGLPQPAGNPAPAPAAWPDATLLTNPPPPGAPPSAAPPTAAPPVAGLDAELAALLASFGAASPSIVSPPPAASVAPPPLAPPLAPAMPAPVPAEHAIVTPPALPPLPVAMPAPAAVMPAAPLPAAMPPAATPPSAMPPAQASALPLPPLPMAPLPMAPPPMAPQPAAPAAIAMPMPWPGAAPPAPAPSVPIPAAPPAMAAARPMPSELPPELLADLTDLPRIPAAAAGAAIPVPRRARAPVAPVAASTETSDLAFWRGLGIEPDSLTPEAREAALEAFGRAMRAAADGLVALLGARRFAKSEFDLEQTQLAAADNNVFKFSPSGEAALRRLMANETGFTPVDLAFSRGFDDLRAHELATAAGVQAALSAMLDRVSPAAIERRFAPIRGGLFTSRRARLWDLYATLHAEIADGAESRFKDVFSRSFANAYGQRARQAAQSEDH